MRSFQPHSPPLPVLLQDPTTLNYKYAVASTALLFYSHSHSSPVYLLIRTELCIFLIKKVFPTLDMREYFSVPLPKIRCSSFVFR